MTPPKFITIWGPQGDYVAIYGLKVWLHYDAYKIVMLIKNEKYKKS